MKRILSWVLLVSMCLSLLPVSALAEDIGLEETASDELLLDDPAVLEEVSSAPVYVPSEISDELQDVEDEADEIDKVALADEQEGSVVPTDNFESDAEGVPTDEISGATITEGIPEEDDPTFEDDDEVEIASVEEADEDNLEVMVTSGTCGDNLSWSLDDEGTLYISGAGKMDDYTSDPAPWHSMREEIRYIVIDVEMSLVSIGADAFAFCNALEGVDITCYSCNISERAFYCCSNLQYVNIVDRLHYGFHQNNRFVFGASCFEECLNLRSIDLELSPE